MFNIPKEILNVTETLQRNGFEAYLVGGCVRDLVRGENPKDWDVTTNAKPEEIQKLFPETFYENDYGTVGVVNEGVNDETLKVVEVTPYRLEEKYSDKRRPDAVKFSGKLEDDLARRDFTMNALAYEPEKKQLVDLYKGQDDIKDKIVRAVGEPKERLEEDALRIVRAVRLASELDFNIEEKTEEALGACAQELKHIAVERIRDEFSRTIMSDTPMKGITLLKKYEILSHIVPELEEGIGTEQNGDHIYDVWEHNLRALQHSADNNWPLHVRISAMLHDVAKPHTRRWSDEKKDWTFYGHDVVGGKMARTILKRLKYSSDMTQTVEKLVRWHLFFSDIDKITLSAVRRLVRNVGPERVWDLMKVRACDRIGMGRPKEKPYRLRKYESMIEEASRAPVSVTMLKISGDTIMEKTGEKPGPRIGFILHALLEEVLDDPKLNTKEYLEKRAGEFVKLSEEELKKIGKSGKEKLDEEEGKVIAEIRKRHYVK
jgi:tRNA nucleotidyltransferase (CCA-adding enzyme)